MANVSKVRLKLADDAWLSIYPLHAPLLAETLSGPVLYTTAAGEQTMSLSESILQVAENAVTLFTGGELTASTVPVGEERDEDAGRGGCGALRSPGARLDAVVAGVARRDCGRFQKLRSTRVNDWLWLFAGLLVGALNVAAIAGSVGRLLRNGKVRPPVVTLSTMLSGFALRLLLSMLVLAIALRYSAAAGLFAFAGIWLGRWPVLFWVKAKVAV